MTITNSSPKTLRRFATSLLAFGFVALATACGGSDDDPAPSSATPNFAGSYAVSFTKTLDSCGTTAASTVSGTDVATQSGRNISVASGNLVFTGTVDADNGGFTVSSTFTSGTATANGTATFRQRTATSQFDERLTVVTTVAGTATSCTVVYEGVATRS